MIGRANTMAEINAASATAAKFTQRRTLREKMALRRRKKSQKRTQEDGAIHGLGAKKWGIVGNIFRGFGRKQTGAAPGEDRATQQTPA